MSLAVIRGAIIPAGQSLSNAVDCSGSARLARIIFPPGWTAAPLTFQLSPDGAAWSDLHHVSVPGAAYNTYEAVVPNPRAGSTVILPTNLGQSLAWVKVRSGTAAAPVAQEADREFMFVVEMPDGAAAGPQGPTGPAGPMGLPGPQGLPGSGSPNQLLQTIVLGHAKGINYNVIGDTMIAIGVAKYAIAQLLTLNNVGGHDNYTGSLRDAAGGAGNDLGGYAYNTDGQLGDWSDYPGPLPVIANPVLYFHVGTKEGAPATGDLYIMGYDLTGL
jgi:hypothetical protein